MAKQPGTNGSASPEESPAKRLVALDLERGLLARLKDSMLEPWRA